MQSFLEIPFHGQMLRGTTHVPEETSDPYPTVVLFHGFTANRIEGHRLFYQLSKALEDVGVASVRMDFLGSGESDGDYADMTLSFLVEQAEHIVSWTRRMAPRVTVYLLGYSLGGLVASLVAEADSTIERVLLLSPGRPRRILQRDAVLYEGSSGVIDVSGNRVGRAYYQGLGDYVNRPANFHPNQDILIVHGTADLATPIEYSEEYLQVPGARKRLLDVPGADHGYSTLEFQRTVIREAVTFLGPP